MPGLISGRARNAAAIHDDPNHHDQNPRAVLLEAGRGIACSDEPPTVVTDAGVENINRNVDELIQSGVLRRVLAVTELRFSNSMIEAWWRTLKPQWLYLNSPDRASTLRRLVAF